MATKAKPELGFDIDDLQAQVDRYDRSPPPPGRPRALPPGTRPVTVRLSAAQHEWTLREAATRTLATGERHDVSRLIRDLIDRAMRAV
jgi:hypothetical protein